MIAQYGELLMFIPVGVLVAEDFRSRTVSLPWLLVLGVLALVVSYVVYGAWTMVANVLSNLFLLLYLSIGILIYLRLRRQRWVNPLRRDIGAGDIAFLAGITPLLDLRGYLLFLICGSLFSLLWMGVVTAAGSRPGTIPFVATMGISMCVILVIKAFL